MTEKASEIKAGMSNPAKILLAYMRCSGISDAKTLAADLDIPIRTIQRLKLECATCANDARNGGPEAPNAPNTPDMAPPMTPDMAFSEIDPSRAHANTESLRDTLVSKTEDSSLSEPDVSDQGEEVTPKAKRRHSYTHGFEEFWKAYPDTTNNSKPEAFKQWRMLTSVEQHNATDGLRHLRAICQRQPDYRCVHACRYLSQRRWESYPSTADRLAGKVVPLSDFKPHPQPMRTITEKELHAMVLADEAMADGARAHG